ncbi:MAG: methylamine utilization protein [Ponticaulis sp.]|nr:methylamine utilization protein [Ponticaulis sp.]
MIGLPALAEGPVTLLVQTQAGEAIPNAVVIAKDSEAEVSADSFDWDVLMEQSDKTFVPYVLIAPLGSEVSFPNRDRMRHHVYSFSKGNRFEIELYGRDETRSIAFDTPGVVAVGCNIHDEMIGYIRVVDTPYAGKTDGAGSMTFTDLPAGTNEFLVWHPDMSERDDVVISWNGASELKVTLDVAPAALAAGNH